MNENLKFYHQSAEFAEDIPKISGFRAWKMPINEQNFCSSNPTAGMTKPPQIQGCCENLPGYLGIAQGWWSREDPKFPPRDGEGDPGYLRSMSEPFGEESERKAPGGGPLSWGDTQLKHSPGDPKNPPWPPLPAASWGQNHWFHLPGTKITNPTFPAPKSSTPSFLGPKSAIPTFWDQNQQSHLFGTKITNFTFLVEIPWESLILGVISERKGPASCASSIWRVKLS